MVQTMSQGLYGMSTVVQGEKLGQFLENDFPSMDNLQVGYALLAAEARKGLCVFALQAQYSMSTTKLPWPVVLQ